MTVTEALAVAGALRYDDPFFYGYRETHTVDENGQLKLEQTPLTREQLLHPGENDYEMASHLHGTLIHYLRYVLELVLSRFPGAYVLSNVNIIWDDPRQLTYRPDLMAIFNVTPSFNWTTFRVREEGVSPRFIIEITSPATHRNDEIDKFLHYARYGLEWYLIVDLEAGTPTKPVPLYFYRLVDGVYRQVQPETNGWLYLAPLDIWIVGEIGDVSCYDSQRRLIESPTAEHAARVATEAELAQAVARADQADAAATTAMNAAKEALARELEAMAQVSEAQARADAEAAARRAAEQQLAEAKALLRQLRSDHER